MYFVDKFSLILDNRYWNKKNLAKITRVGERDLKNLCQKMLRTNN